MVSTLSVVFKITAQSVLVPMATMEIHLPDAILFHLVIYIFQKYSKPFSNTYTNFILATTRPNDVMETRDPCYPSPCGLNSQCRNQNRVPSCSCLPTYIGAPPNCRPECVINQECTSSKACIREKCQDPCLGACGLGAQCTVRDHTANCVCFAGYIGDPFSYCQQAPVIRKNLFVQ